MPSSLICFLLLSGWTSLSVQQSHDPIKDFCRRFDHATTVIDRKLYIDSGYLNWNPLSQYPANVSNTYLLYNDLNDSPVGSGMPQLHSSLGKNATIPNVSGGTLWADTVNKVFYQFGGQSTGSTLPPSLWAYDAVLNQWNNSNVPDNLNRVSWGAGVAVDQRAEGYYLGGWQSNATSADWQGSPRMTSNLIRYDMIQQTFSNSTGPDVAGRGEGVLLFLPASDAGLLVYFGGLVDPSNNGTVFGSPMNIIYIYDIASTRWYSQNASGSVPEMRRRFCGGVTWADDQSSYNIYLYGGLSPNGTAFDDVYILSLPSFTWIKWWPSIPGPGRPHHSMTCNVINRSQMLIIGGTFPFDQDCDAPTVWGTHNMNLGANGPNNAIWDLFYPNITTYQVPPAIISQIGGGPSGGATVTKPQGDWNNRDLPIYFSRVPRFATRTPTRAPTVASAIHRSHGKLYGGAIGGIVVGALLGGIVLLSLLVIGLLLCFRHLRQRRQRGTIRKPAELPAIGAARPTSSLAHEKTESPFSYSQHLTPESERGRVLQPPMPPALPSARRSLQAPPRPPRPDEVQVPPGVYPMGPYYAAVDNSSPISLTPTPDSPPHTPVTSALVSPISFLRSPAPRTPPMYRNDLLTESLSKRYSGGRIDPPSVTTTPRNFYPDEDKGGDGRDWTGAEDLGMGIVSPVDGSPKAPRALGRFREGPSGAF